MIAITEHQQFYINATYSFKHFLQLFFIVRKRNAAANTNDGSDAVHRFCADTCRNARYLDFAFDKVFGLSFGSSIIVLSRSNHRLLGLIAFCHSLHVQNCRDTHCKTLISSDLLAWFFLEF